MNVGVLLGEPSGWLIDIDLDHPRCVELAPEHLPPTPAIFGRPGKPRSHYLYRVTGPVPTKKHKSKSSGMLVELRSTGLQTVFPPSTHECGELIAWEPGAEASEPAAVDPDVLLAAVESLANAVKVELGERSAARSTQTSSNPAPDRSARRIESKILGCVAEMDRMRVTDQRDGSGRLFAAACRTVEHDLNDDQALQAIRAYAASKPFPQEWTDEEILKRVRDAESKATRSVIARDASSSGKTKVVIDTDEHRVVTESIAALAADEGLYHRGGVLVRILRDHDDDGSVRRGDGVPAISFLPPPALRERLTKHIEFTHFVQRGDLAVEVLTHPTPWLVAAIDARGEWPGLRPLKGVSDVPVLRPDGSLWQTPGYDTQTGVLYAPSAEFPEIHDQVGLDDADAAIEKLHEVVCDFAFDGPTPLFLIDANIRGAGKGLLAQTIGHLVLGREMPVSSYAHDTEEMRKKITSIAIAGDRVIHLDNLEGAFGNDALDRALTTTRWKDRILGKSQEVDLPLIPVWYGTGNNVQVAADTARRIIHVRLDVLEERPEERTGFRHPQLLSWIGRERPRLVAAALTILRGYVNAGRPRQDIPAFGSFEGWSSLVREAIVWAGQPDPCATRDRLAEQADTSADALVQLIDAWRMYDDLHQGIVVSETVARLYSKDFPPRDEAANAMRAALENLVGCPPGRTPGPRQVGSKLRHYRRRNVGGFYIDTDPNEPRRNGAVWRLHHA
jgi:hypothetical protein